jgi:1,4-dihydroxy-6-naphthoate synthase
VRLAFSPCPNDTFVFHAWVHGLVEGPATEVRYADIDVTNGAAEQGAFDVIKVSYAALPWLLHSYRLLPCGGAVGRGCGPLLLTRDALPDLDGRSVAVPSQRSTAYLLFRLWAAGQQPKVDVVPFTSIMPAVRDGKYDAGLVIHEARFTFASYGLSAMVDLGAWWEADTGLPVPLGAVIARHTVDADLVATVIRASVEYAWAHPDASAGYVAAHAAEMSAEVQRQHIALYVNEFTRELGAEGYGAAAVLLARAHQGGLTPPVASLR